ncbi:TRAP transporter small permease [Celeribacter indicus]|uniref:TRAP transporter small permease protein n=1 Tax=Celeribacter indicus TaxID=1208324 RepID=A0A0B5DQ24_9RHOB|nr:TRAP transporter small permease [Celeribacter indicus]AJE45219.1 TRAP-type C4-dicarboxylate transport system small permease [Celeribacter indicus]SDX45570.1 TRAP-type C4-dicarboxylate transport system, small permease component [Celeribacter indicus]
MKDLLRHPLRAILRLHDVLISVSYWLGSLALLLIVAIFAYEVVMRYFLDAPTKWGSDFVSFLLLISLFLVIPHVTRIQGNVSVSILLDILGGRSAEIVRRLGFAVGAAVCIWVGFIFWGETQRLIARGTVTLTTVQVPKWWLYAFVFFGMLNTGLYFLRLALGDRFRTVKGAGE